MQIQYTATQIQHKIKQNKIITNTTQNKNKCNIQKIQIHHKVNKNTTQKHLKYSTTSIQIQHKIQHKTRTKNVFCQALSPKIPSPISLGGSLFSEFLFSISDFPFL